MPPALLPEKAQGQSPGSMLLGHKAGVHLLENLGQLLSKITEVDLTAPSHPQRSVPHVYASHLDVTDPNIRSEIP